jgi:aminoglycoside 2'-N-acetyltransferase I
MNAASRVVRVVESEGLDPDEVRAIRALLDAAFDDEDPEERFAESDWQHALGGVHVVVTDAEGTIVSHAAVVPRELHAGDIALRTGYVEAVATRPDRQGEGFGTVAMRRVNEIIRDGYDLGGLGTGAHHFYERLGWRTWRGPSFVRTPAGPVATPEDDGYVLILATPRTPPDLDVDGPISCEWRPGDVW